MVFRVLMRTHARRVPIKITTPFCIVTGFFLLKISQKQLNQPKHSHYNTVSICGVQGKGSRNFNLLLGTTSICLSKI